MRTPMVPVIGGLILLAAIGWQAFELRRLTTAHAELSAQLSALTERLAPSTQSPPTDTRATTNTPPPETRAQPIAILNAPSQSRTELESPRGPTSHAIIAPTPPGPPADLTGGQPPPPPPRDPCHATCDRAIDCALNLCRVPTTATAALATECRATCAQAPDLAATLNAITACAEVITTARGRLPTFDRACR